MFIQTEQTPNPSTLKFLPGRMVMETGTLDFAGPDTAATSPLAKRLFAVEGVERVFFGADFVTVTKAVERDWQILKPSILGGIMEHFTSGEPVVSGGEAATDGSAASGEDDDEIVAILGLTEGLRDLPEPTAGCVQILGHAADLEILRRWRA